MFRMLMASTALALITLPVAAQVDRTGPSGGPLSTERAGNVTATGQTKPPSRDASPTSQADVNRRTANDANQDAISKGICIGCSPK